MEMFRGGSANRMEKVSADCKSTGTQVSYAWLPEQTANLPERQARQELIYTEFRIKSFEKMQKCLYLQPKTEMWRDLAACNHTKKC